MKFWSYPEKRRIWGLEALRALCCVAVVIHHYAEATSKGFGMIGCISVSCFFVLSGFLAGLRIDQELPKIGSYFAKRFRKLAPLYLVVFICMLPFQYWITRGTPNHLAVVLRQALPCFLMIQAWLPNVLNIDSSFGFAWFVSAILFCYLLTPLFLRLVKQWSRAARRAALLGTCAVYLVMSLCFRDQTSAVYFLYSFPLTRALQTFGAVILGAEMKDMPPRSERTGKGTLAEALSLLLCAGLTLWNLLYFRANAQSGQIWLEGWQSNLQLFLCYPASLVLVGVFALDSGWITRFLENRLTFFISGFSYEIYMLHMPCWCLFQLAANLVPALVNYQILLAIPTLILACFLWRWLQGLFRKRKKA